jgi:hypothetical protein
MQSERDLVGMRYTPGHNALEFNRIVGDGADSISSASMISGSRIEFSAWHTWEGAFIGNYLHQQVALEARRPVPLPQADHPRDHAGKQQHGRGCEDHAGHHRLAASLSDVVTMLMIRIAAKTTRPHRSWRMRMRRHIAHDNTQILLPGVFLLLS